MTRPVFQERVVWNSDSQPISRTASSRSSERSAFIAFGPSATPAPISFSSIAASYTLTSNPRRSNAPAAVSPPMPPPIIAIRAVRGILDGSFHPVLPQRGGGVRTGNVSTPNDLHDSLIPGFDWYW
jgi:hypothetical protein